MGGITPASYINRTAVVDTVVNNFESNVQSNHIYMLSGVRGSGKTVTMTEISRRLRQNKSWIVIELNSADDLMTDLASKLYSYRELRRAFLKAKVDLSVLGIGVHIEGSAPASSMHAAIEEMLEIIRKKGKKVLIDIDDVSNSKSMRIFSGAFQILMREEYPVYLLMTGLYENLYDLQNQKNLTFLYRAPKIPLGPLDAGMVTDSYRMVFSISENAARKMAAYTKCYPYGYQQLGFLYWENKDHKTLTDILPEYRHKLAENVYGKIWSELSGKDRKVVRAMSELSQPSSSSYEEDYGVSTSELRASIGMKTPNALSVYRERLINKGIVEGTERGILRFTLPFFREFVLDQIF